MEKEIFDFKGADKEVLMYIGASLVALLLPIYKVSFLGLSESIIGFDLVFSSVYFIYIVVLLAAFAVQVVPQVRDHELVKQNSKVIDIVIPAVLAFITFSMTRSVKQAALGMGSRTIFAYLLIVAHIGFALYKSGQLNTIIDKIKTK